ncbi:hypothetical protein Tco_1147780 [Tanacetum coccineum]
MDVDDHEIIHPYNEMDPLNRPPPDFDSEPEEAVAPVGRSTLQFLLPIRRFSGTVYVGEGSSSTAFTANHRKMKDYVEVEFSTLKMLANGDRHMNLFDDDLSRLDSALREEIQSRIKMEQLVAELGLLPPHMRYQETPCVAPTVLVILVAHDDPNDSYVATHNAATVPAVDDDGSATPGDPRPFKSRGSPRDS